METNKTNTPYARTMNSLFDGWNTQIGCKAVVVIRGFLADNYPSTKLVQLNSGKYYLQEESKGRLSK